MNRTACSADCRVKVPSVVAEAYRFVNLLLKESKNEAADQLIWLRGLTDL